MKYGCSTLLWGGHPLDAALAGIARAGFEAIELCSIPGMGADHLPEDASPAEVAKIRRMIEAHGLAIDSVGASTNLANPEARDRFVRVMEGAARLGARAIATGPGGVANDEQSFVKTAEAVRELARRGEELGVRLAIKPHHSSIAFNTATALRLMAEVGSSWVRLNFDASHIFRANEDPVEALKRLAPFVGNARIRDAKSVVQGVPPVDEQVCGGGSLDLPGLIRLMRAIGGLKFAVLEIVGTKGFPLERIQAIAKQSADYLKATG